MVNQTKFSLYAIFLLHWGSYGGIFELIRPWAEKYFFDLTKKSA